jgi:hypothetical protein
VAYEVAVKSVQPGDGGASAVVVTFDGADLLAALDGVGTLTFVERPAGVTEADDAAATEAVVSAGALASPPALFTAVVFPPAPSVADQQAAAIAASEAAAAASSASAAASIEAAASSLEAAATSADAAATVADAAAQPEVQPYVHPVVPAPGPAPTEAVVVLGSDHEEVVVASIYGSAGVELVPHAGEPVAPPAPETSTSDVEASATVMPGFLAGQLAASFPGSVIVVEGPEEEGPSEADLIDALAAKTGFSPEQLAAALASIDKK